MSNKIINWTLDQIVSDRFGRYSKYIIQERALPDARDGLKPVQRRILYAMYNLRLFHNKPFKKSARVVGEVIGKYHPHGDTSIYDALVRISQPWKMNMPLTNMHGNNGSIDDDPAAAMRYTEIRLTQIAETMLQNIESNAVDFIPNFDDSEKEPTVLPALMPNLLVNGARGIAAGFATEMPPHNLKEIIEAIIIKIKSPNCRLDTILNSVQGPDFPTGGTVFAEDNNLYKVFERGMGRIIIRSKYNINSSKTNPYIEITEIPYGVVKAKLVKEIAEIKYNNKIYGIKEVRDETDRTGLRIMIQLIPGSNAKMILIYLLKKTQMQIYYSYNNVAIVNNTPKQMSIINLIDAYIQHQRKVIISYSKYHHNKKTNKLEIVNGLIKVAQNIDEIITLIRQSTGSKKGVVLNLIQFGFTENQAVAIADLQLYRLSKTDESLYLEDKLNLEKELFNLEKIINNSNELDRYIINKLKEFSNKYKVERKTIIAQNIEDLPDIDDQALIKKEDVHIGISKLGYVKSISNKAFLANEINKYKLKDEDILVFLEMVNSLDTLIIFTNKGRFLKIQAHKIPVAKFSSNGVHINDLTMLYTGEKIISCFNINDLTLDKQFILISKFGQIKKSHLSSFKKNMSTKFLTSFKLVSLDEVVAVQLSNNSKNIIVFTNTNHAVKYPETDVHCTGLKTAGIKAIKLKDNYVANMVVAYDEQVLGLISNRGGLKRIKAQSILPYSRISFGKEISLYIKGNPHIIENVAIVLPSTVFLLNIKGKIIKGKFNQVDITNNTVGFSKVYSNIIGSIIFKEKKHDVEIENNQESLEDRFKKAEEKMNAISQLSLNELLKKKED